MGTSNKLHVKFRKKKERKDKMGKSGKSHEKTSNLKRRKEISNDDKLEEAVTEEESEAGNSSSGEMEEYEKVPRMQKYLNIRNLLPVKNKGGLVFRSETVKDKNESEEYEDPVDEKQKVRKGRTLTLVERYAIQKRVLDDLKCKVALLCTSLVENPENNMPAMKELLSLLYETKTQMVISEKKILCVSLLHVFLDILPSYKIRNDDDKDPKVQLKKETRKLMAYERNLLRHYKKYIDYLCKLIQDMKIKKKQASQLSELKIKASREVGLIAVKCLCDLLSAKFSVNYFKNIANTLVPLATELDETISNLCCQSFENMFKADKLGEASFDLVRQIANLVKERKFCVLPCLLKSFFCLNFKEAKPEVPKIDMKKGRKEWQNMSHTQRRRKKKIKGLEAELKEAQAHESVETVKKFHIQTLNKVFWVYFHVLKDHGEKLSLLGPSLEGLSKFAYLINLEFFDDLNAVLCNLMETGSLSNVDKLHSVYTLFTILAGQAESLHIDPHKIYCHMYQGLLTLSHYTDVEHFILSLKCLEFNILRKRKKISFGRILAFTKRLSTVSLQTPIHGTLALLCAIRNILWNVGGSDILLDTERSVGSGIYFPEMEDPEHCNAQSTALWELHLLKKHYNPFIKLYSQYLLQRCPRQGRLSLPEALEKSTPEDTLNLFADIAVQNKMDFLEETAEPPKKKFKFVETDDFIYEKDLDIELNWQNLKNISSFIG